MKQTAHPRPFKCHVIRLALSVFLAVATLACAEPRLPKVLSDNMVLQRGIALPVWGWAEPGEKVTVAFAGQNKIATADAEGKWMLRLDPTEASGEPRDMTITGAADNSKTTIRNILVGDVWICSGQSNMEWSLHGARNGKEEAAAADHPLIRLFDVRGHIKTPAAQDDAPGQWRLCSPSTVGGFSAVGYFFGRRLHAETGVPIGLIGSNWGGTAIEPWVPPAGFGNVAELSEVSKHLRETDPRTAEGKAGYMKYLDTMQAWMADAEKALEQGKHPSLPPKTPSPLGKHREATGIYNGMVHPLVPFGLKGAIWYQGESNGGEGITYYHKMKALITGWRTVWGQGDFPFYFVQLANFQQPNDNPAGGDGWAKLREAQCKTLEIPQTGMAVIIDIGEARDIHPKNKQDVGSRLAQWALHQAYGKKDLVPSGPLFREQKIEGGKIRISFDHVGSGLIVGAKDGLEPVKEVADGKLARFAVAGEDRKWHWAEALIEGESVVVGCEAVPTPVAVRYAYSMNPEGANLYNKEGLPASPFRTDAW